MDVFRERDDCMYRLKDVWFYTLGLTILLNGDAYSLRTRVDDTLFVQGSTVISWMTNHFWFSDRNVSTVPNPTNFPRSVH